MVDSPRQMCETGALWVDDRPTIEELNHLYALLTHDERDDLLQELLAAAAQGGEAMAVVMDVWLLDRAGREFLDSLD